MIYLLHNRIYVCNLVEVHCVYCTCLSVFAFHFSTKRVYVFRISCKDLKSMLSQVNYRVPNMRFLREKLPVTSSYLSQSPFPLHLPAHFPFNMMSLEAKDLWFVVNGPFAFPPRSSTCFIGLRVEEWRRVLQPVCPALSQPHVWCSEKRKCSQFYYICTDSSVPALSSPSAPSDALPRHPSSPICLFSNGCEINMDQLKTHQTPLVEAIRTHSHGWGGRQAGWLGSD